MKPTDRSAPTPSPAPVRLLRRLAVVFGAWTLYGVLFASFLQAMRPRLGLPIAPFWGLLRYSLLNVWIWAALTLPIVVLARKFPVALRTAWHRVPLHLGFAVAAHVTHASATWWLRPHVGAGPRASLPEAILGTLFFDLFVYAGLVAIVHAVDAQAQAGRLRHALLESELRLLRMQLQPHFLFNTLNAVSELVHRDPDRAERALARLGDLLRWSLQSSALQEVTLREELEALDHYLEIQRLRHGAGLALTVEAPPDTLGLAVPSLLLQPLVENAIRHGVRGASQGEVSVVARREDERLSLVVRDDGRGIAAGWREGTGLRTTRARLEGLYGARQRLEIHSDASGGTSVEVTLPARAAAAAGGAGRP